MNINDEKISQQQDDALENNSDSGQASGSNIAASISSEDASEQIVHHLQTTGEEIGLTWRTCMAAAGMCMCYNTYLFTLLIPPTILSYINAELGPDPRYTWITISWNLGGAMFVTIGGRLSDIFGRRYFFLTGSGLLIIGSIVSATGQSISQMIAGGTIFGAGSGFLEMSFGAVQEIVPSRYRAVTIGLFDASSIIAQMMPLIAWVIIRNTHNWRVCYYTMIGFQALNFAFLFFFYNPPKFRDLQAEHGKTKTQILKDFDYVGLFLFIAGCTLFIVGLSWGGSLYPWNSGAAIAPIVIGFGALVGLGFYEAYANLKEPLFPPRLFKAVRHFTMPLIVMAVGGMQYYSNATLWTRLSQLLYAGDEISKGLYAEAIPLGTILGGIAVTFSKKIGHQRWQVFFAVGLQTACVGAMSTASIDNAPKSIILTVIISLTSSLIILNGMVLVGFGIVYQEDIGTAAGLAGTSRLLAGAVATAIFSNVTNNKYVATLPEQVRASVASFDLPTDVVTRLITAAAAGTSTAYNSIPGITPDIEAAATMANKVSYLAGAHLSYQVALAFGLFGCIAALFVPTVDTRKYTKRTVAPQQADKKALKQNNGAV
ncbi:fungal trichothecene efflux pump [Aspergillus ambiguus]|uniref:fungal trichothecene efflux pump n=1 Tax=Aspergillus ambiguus TaxID=176160 RepID=UPI003CCCB160